tara:strand:+ start:1682 stop:1927 length:246 start_codon:yes stop_codon:yes gene_type:complete
MHFSKWVGTIKKKYIQRRQAKRQILLEKIENKKARLEQALTEIAEAMDKTNPSSSNFSVLQKRRERVVDNLRKATKRRNKL